MKTKPNALREALDTACTRIRLTPLQSKHVDSLRWLMGGGRATGRTFLLAWVALEYACGHPLERVAVRDHFPTHEADFRLLDEISSIARAIPVPLGRTLLDFVEFNATGTPGFVVHPFPGLALVHGELERMRNGS